MSKWDASGAYDTLFVRPYPTSTHYRYEERDGLGVPWHRGPRSNTLVTR
ncbi:hypothetical protein [Escherichia coli]